MRIIQSTLITNLVLLMIILCLVSTDHDHQIPSLPGFFLFLLFFTLLFLLPLLSTTTWLTPGGFAWNKYSRIGAPVAPGPIGWPLLGSLSLIKSPLAHRKLAKLSMSYPGARELMALSLGATRVVISSHPDTAREILHGAAFSDRPVKVSARYLMFERAIGFAPASSGTHWRHLRRIVTADMFSPRRIAVSAGLRLALAEEMTIRVWQEMEKKEKVSLRGVLKWGSLENIMGSLFGREALGGGEKEELMEMVREGYELIGEFNLEDYIPLGGLLDVFRVEGRCKSLASRVRSLVGKVIEERRRRRRGVVDDNYCSINIQEDRDFLTVLLSLPEEEKLCDLDMIAVLWEMIFRGTDVVAILLEWTMARLVLHPTIQDKVQQELATATGGRTVQDSDLPNLRYLQAVVKETLRMHPPGPLLSWARLAVRDVHVGKYVVPEGTTAMVNMWAITHDESNWKDPWVFRPERFMGEEEKEQVGVLGSDMRLAPFGSGRRVCPGRALGLATAHLWLAYLMQKYRWVAVDDQPVRLSECLQLSLEMKYPLMCRVTPTCVIKQ